MISFCDIPSGSNLRHPEWLKSATSRVAQICYTVARLTSAEVDAYKARSCWQVTHPLMLASGHFFVPDKRRSTSNDVINITRNTDSSTLGIFFVSCTSPHPHASFSRATRINTHDCLSFSKFFLPTATVQVVILSSRPASSYVRRAVRFRARCRCPVPVRGVFAGGCCSHTHRIDHSNELSLAKYAPRPAQVAWLRVRRQAAAAAAVASCVMRGIKRTE